MNRKVVVSGIGIVSSIGIGKDTFWKNLINGISGIKEVTLFDTSKYSRHLAGEITGLYTGNWISALIDAIKLVDEIFSAEIEEAADIVIGSAGVIPAILTSIRHPN